MTDNQHDIHVAAIEKHFADMGWVPLLAPKRVGLREMPIGALEALLPTVLNAAERLTAVTAILGAIAKPRGYDPPDDRSDSVQLNLR